MAAVVGVISAIASIAGTAVSVMGAMAQGEAAKEAAEFEARQLEKRANEARALGQKRMFEEQRKKEYTQSRLRAVAASSTGDTTDPTVLHLGQGIEERGEYAALTEFTAGENRARGFQDQAAAALYKGKMAQQGAKFRAIGTAFEGVTSFAKQYNSFYG